MIDDLDTWHLRIEKPYLQCEFCGTNVCYPERDKFMNSKINTYRKLLKHTNDYHLKDDKIAQRKYFKKIEKIVLKLSKELNYEDIPPDMIGYN